MKARSVRLAAIALLCAMLWAVLAQWPLISQAFAFVAGIFTVATISSIVRKPRDKYDLGLLREIDQKAQFREVEDMHQSEFDSVICPNCATVFSPLLKVCPGCGRSVFSSC